MDAEMQRLERRKAQQRAATARYRAKKCPVRDQATTDRQKVRRHTKKEMLFRALRETEEFKVIKRMLGEARAVCENNPKLIRDMRLLVDECSKKE